LQKEADYLLDFESVKKTTNIKDINSRNKALKETASNIQVPLSIFNNPLSPLETVVRYLKDILGFSHSQTAKVLSRNETTIWTTYNNSTSKIDKLSIELTPSIHISFVPLLIFSNRSLSILENLCLYLNKNGMTCSKIAKAINRNDKTVWTVISRAKTKLNEK